MGWFAAEGFPKPAPAPAQEHRQDQHDARNKPTRVGPIGNTTAQKIALQPADQLQAKPKPQHQPRGDCEDLDEHHQDHQHVDPGAREHQQIAPHHCRNCA